MKKQNQLVKVNQAFQKALLNQFPTASLSEIREESQPKTYQYFTRTANGTVKTLPKPKTQLYRTTGEGRERPIMSHRPRKIKLKQEYWDKQTLVNFFLNNSIHLELNEQGWFITSNHPARKLTKSDQIEIFLSKNKNPYLIGINQDHKHLVINDLNPKV